MSLQDHDQSQNPEIILICNAVLSLITRVVNVRNQTSQAFGTRSVCVSLFTDHRTSGRTDLIAVESRLLTILLPFPILVLFDRWSSRHGEETLCTLAHFCCQIRNIVLPCRKTKRSCSRGDFLPAR